jgi:UDP-N-acetylmuramate--alanine ligase
MKHKVKHIHFVGVGGSGMSGIAEVLAHLDFTVTGSDIVASATTRRLEGEGVKVMIGHAAENAAGADAVVISTAVKADNPEVMAARERKIPVVPRAQMLAELMRLKSGIAIAGTHGKTTTTSLVTSILAEGGIDPTFVIGGRLNAAGANARLGSGDFLVAEADESDASFLFLSPVLSVVTNIDADHMETYGHDFERLKSAFVDFLNRLPFYGVAVVCGDDANVRDILPRVPKQIITYGLAPENNFYAEDVVAEDGRMRFTCVRVNGTTTRLPIVLNTPGLHNVLNALAAIAVATEVQVPDAAIVKALAEFKGAAGWRFLHAGRRLRPSPGRNGCDAGRRPWRLPRPPPAARLPAAPLQPHPRLLRGLRQGAEHGRCVVPGRHLRRRRSAHRRRRRPLAGPRPARRRQGRAGLRRGHRGDAANHSRCRPRWRRRAVHGRRFDRRRARQAGGAAMNAKCYGRPEILAKFEKYCGAKHV